MLIRLYRLITHIGAPFLKLLLYIRLKAGKEDATRLRERMGKPGTECPDGKLLWIHAASVGEAQSALILLDKIKAAFPNINILMTSGTVTSASLMDKRLPNGARHQYYPLDRTKWCKQFLNHWSPSAILWMESELWPNMLRQIRKRKIPAALVNARMSMQSARRWGMFPKIIKDMLRAFNIVLAQTPMAKTHFEKLGAKKVIMTDNLKFSAAPLPYDADALTSLENALGTKQSWVYASTHKGEEELAITAHKHLKKLRSDILTIIVPRHPERRDDIETILKQSDLNYVMRGDHHTPPSPDTDIYVVDTLGELGLFYRLANIAMIGRSFSDDGGGGHNPIEAAQLDCAVLSGPNVQYQTQIFDAMIQSAAARIIKQKEDLPDILETLFSKPQEMDTLKNNARNFALQKEKIVDDVMEALAPVLKNLA